MATIVPKVRELTLEEKKANTAREREILIERAEEKISEAKESAGWSYHKYFAFVAAFFGSIIGTFMILFGLAKTVLFETFNQNYALAGCGGIFFTPWLYFIYLMFCAGRNERLRRKRINDQQRTRKKPSLFNNLLDEAENQRKNDTKPNLIQLIAVIRGGNGQPQQKYSYAVTTLRTFCEFVEHDTGLPIHRQKILYKGHELIEYDMHMAEDYQLPRNSELHIFNRGKYMTDLMERNKLFEKRTQTAIEIEDGNGENKEEIKGDHNNRKSTLAQSESTGKVSINGIGTPGENRNSGNVSSGASVASMSNMSQDATIVRKF